MHVTPLVVGVNSNFIPMFGCRLEFSFFEEVGVWAAFGSGKVYDFGRFARFSVNVVSFS